MLAFNAKPAGTGHPVKAETLSKCIAGNVSSRQHTLGRQGQLEASWAQRRRLLAHSQRQMEERERKREQAAISR